jgi:hypothetical protein
MTGQAESVLEQDSHDFYVRTLETLNAASVPFLVGGAYAFQCYTGITRHTKDLDLFVRPRDVDRALHTLADAGYKTELTFPHWLGKAFFNDSFVDLIFKSGNGISEVDDSWFKAAPDDRVLDVPVKIVSAEDMLWTKLFIMERERYDGADVAHLFRARAKDLDWQRLVSNIGDHWRVLLSHLILFGFIYPAERDHIPAAVMRELIGRLDREMTETAPADRVCQGTFLSRAQYLIDVEEWGYRDARIGPDGTMTRREAAQWTAAIEDEE